MADTDTNTAPTSELEDDSKMDTECAEGVTEGEGGTEEGDMSQEEQGSEEEEMEVSNDADNAEEVTNVQGSAVTDTGGSGEKSEVGDAKEIVGGGGGEADTTRVEEGGGAEEVKSKVQGEGGGAEEVQTKVPGEGGGAEEVQKDGGVVEDEERKDGGGTEEEQKDGGVAEEMGGAGDRPEIGKEPSTDQGGVSKTEDDKAPEGGVALPQQMSIGGGAEGGLTTEGGVVGDAEAGASVGAEGGAPDPGLRSSDESSEEEEEEEEVMKFPTTLEDFKYYFNTG